MPESNPALSVSCYYSLTGSSPQKFNRARLFKTNEFVSKCFVKISNINVSNTPIFFVEKMCETFALQKCLSFFQQKISVYLVVKS